MCNFVVGQKVVCVDDKFDRIGTHHPDLHKGNIYTISQICKCDGGYYKLQKNEGYAVRLEGVRMLYWWPGEIGEYTDRFAAARFRPLVTKKTDISIFTEMLKVRTKELTQ